MVVGLVWRRAPWRPRPRAAGRTRRRAADLWGRPPPAQRTLPARRRLVTALRGRPRASPAGEQALPASLRAQRPVCLRKAWSVLGVASHAIPEPLAQFLPVPRMARLTAFPCRSSGLKRLGLGLELGWVRPGVFRIGVRWGVMRFQPAVLSQQFRAPAYLCAPEGPIAPVMGVLMWRVPGSASAQAFCRKPARRLGESR
jgi:hypothetical protein